MLKRLITACASALLVLGLAGSTLASNHADSGHLQRSPMTDTVHSTLNFGIYFMPDVPVSQLEWELELEYDLDDVAAVYDHYDQALMRLGFSRTSYESDDDKIEARYAWAGLRASLEVESEDHGTRVDLEIEGHASASDGSAFRFDEFGGINFPFFNATITAIEWQVEFRHTTRDYERVFRYYDQGLLSQGWYRTAAKYGVGTASANYVNGGQKIELAVERKRDYVSVDFELE
ncbi:MAG: hypothetical protein WC972_09500 [Trueperaceae bacterium]